MHPILIPFKFPIYTYGTLVALAFLAGLRIVLDRAARAGISKNLIFNVFLGVMAGAITGARLLYVVENWTYFRTAPLEILMVQHGGLSYFGGFVMAVTVSVFVIWHGKRKFFEVADIFMPALALGQAIGRLGCYFNGCCYGVVTNGSWGIRFPRGSAVFTDHEARGWLTPWDSTSLSVVPVQWISSLMDAALFCALTVIDDRKTRTGTTFFAYLFGYGLIRFGLELLRGDNPTVAMGWTLPQWLSAAGIMAGLAGLALLHRGQQSPQPV